MSSITIEQNGKEAKKYKFSLESHTFGNLISRELQKHKHVKFAAYNIPHPLEDKMELSVMTKRGIDPTEVLRSASSSLIEKLSLMENVLKDALEKKEKK